MNKVSIAGFSLAALVVLATASSQPAEAKQWQYGVNARQHRQHNRICNGVQSGQLTKRESRRIRGQEAVLRKQEAYYRATGNGLSNKERNRLEREQNHLSHEIYNQKHDGQTR
ncbi:MAG: hypothetical protein JSS86_24420 [Cyanobacteria bacterium SZAS LIN-2]|nr:hypothetical protein [Cyanobacteria bacterium SZAS LIN-3]MBS1999504.1 hypothetical protein [Cyanobacteria bacterium SZAS LIN-2]MBS2007518.1 hypothetical protein [Cyanobacteria bacterium SZAS TMP-1]